MIRSLKALGAATVAALAMSAMFAPGAQAETGSGVFTSGDTDGNPSHTAATIIGHRYGTAEGNFFEVSGDKLTCTEATFPAHEGDGTADGTANLLTVTAEYKHCENSEGRPITVEMNGCDYTLTQPVKLPAGDYTSTVDLFCPENSAIVIHVAETGSYTNHTGTVCTTEVAPHVGTEETVGHAILKETVKADGSDDVTVEVVADNVPWFKPAGQICNFFGDDEGTDGKYRSTVTVEATSAGHEVWISDEE